MFNKEESNIFGNIHIKNTSFYKKNTNALITPSFAVMYNSYIENKNMEEQLDYEAKKTTYINRKSEFGIKKQYNQKIVDLYQSGRIIIDKKEYLLKDLFIVYKNSKEYNLLNIKVQHDYEYTHAVKFIDTTAFINLINSSEVIVNDNTVYTNTDTLNNLVKNWDGYLHDQVNVTDAISDKKVVRDDNNE